MIEIEIKNFYPFERNDQKQFLKGGLHLAIKLADNIEINVRGILASKQKERYFFRMPFRNGSDLRDGSLVSFPILSFENPELNKIVMDSLYTKAPVFIESFLSANPQLLEEQKTLVESSPSPQTIMQPKPNKQAPGIKNSIASIATREWRDPPPRKSPAKPVNKYGAKR